MHARNSACPYQVTVKRAGILASERTKRTNLSLLKIMLGTFLINFVCQFSHTSDKSCKVLCYFLTLGDEGNFLFSVKI
jgi:hypothetical protein